jgi:cell cycle sensor histidine kinase DivJ
MRVVPVLRKLKLLWEGRKEAMLAADQSHRPEAMRKAALKMGARSLWIAALIGLAFGVYGVVIGEPLTFIVSTVAMVGAVLATLAERRGSVFALARIEIATIMAVGTILTISSSAVADFGLATALLGPVLAALVADRRTRVASWYAFAGIALANMAFHLSGLGILDAWETVTGAAAFGAFALVVAAGANRIATAYEVFDKTQLVAYQHLVENVRDAVMRFSAQGEVLFVSRSTETLLGCRRYELSGRMLGERIHVADRPTYLTAFADSSQGGINRDIEVRMRRDADTALEFIWVEISLSPVPSTPDTLRREVVAVFRDVTERRRQDAEMLAAKGAAEEASQAKSRFLATIGHELRTPLNAVVGFSEMMASGIGGELSKTHQEYAGLIHQSGRHLLDVIGMLLDMSKIEAGKFEISPEPFEAQRLVQPCFRMVDSLAQNQGVSLKADIEPDLPMLCADERALRQILINLLSNAIKFSHKGGEVTVTLKRQGMAINLSVTDRGIGMEPMAIARIGEPFFQANAALNRQHEGTGLGLSIVKGLTELHGGTLRAMSEVGTGTVVTVLLPINGPETVSVETATVTQLPRAPVPVSATSWQDGKRKAL